MQYATRWSLERPQIERLLHNERSNPEYIMARRALASYYAQYDRIVDGEDTVSSIERYLKRVISAHIEVGEGDRADCDIAAEEFSVTAVERLEQYDRSDLLRDGHLALLPLESLSDHLEYVYSAGQRAVWFADNAGRVLTSVREAHGSSCTDGLGQDVDTLDCTVSDECPRRKIRSHLLSPLHYPDELAQTLGLYEDATLAKLQAALAVDLTTIEDEAPFIEKNLERNR